MRTRAVAPLTTSCSFGPLPIILPILRRLRLRETIDALVPVTGRAAVTHGQVIEALVLNRLIAPRALHGVEDWSKFFAIEDALGIEPSDLNDDRLTRALDAVFPVLDKVQGTLAWRAMEDFSIDPSWIHWDMTSFVFEGDYADEEQDAQAPRVGLGKSKDRDAGLRRKQMQVGYALASDAKVPFWHRAFSGNAAEVSEVSGVMQSLLEVVRRNKFTLIGDSKLISQANLEAAFGHGICFVAPESRNRFSEWEFFQHRSEQGWEPWVVPQRTSREEPEPNTAPKTASKTRRASRTKRSSTIYLGFETQEWKQFNDELQRLRRLYIVSSEERRATRKNRKRQLRRFWEGVVKAQKNLGKYSYTTPTQVRGHIERLIGKTDLQDVIQYRVSGRQQDHRQREIATDLEISFDREAYKRKRQTDGVYTLLTNLPLEHSGQTILLRYKRQFLSERRFADLKGPLRLRPLFLKKNRRLTALVSVISFALMVYCLLEYSIAKSLKETGSSIPRLHSKRPTTTPTARMMMDAFEFCIVTKETDGDHVHFKLPLFNELQALIVQHLGIEDPWSFLD